MMGGCNYKKIRGVEVEFELSSFLRKPINIGFRFRDAIKNNRHLYKDIWVNCSSFTDAKRKILKAQHATVDCCMPKHYLFVEVDPRSVVVNGETIKAEPGMIIKTFDSLSLDDGWAFCDGRSGLIKGSHLTINDYNNFSYCEYITHPYYLRLEHDGFDLTYFRYDGRYFTPDLRPYFFEQKC